MQWSVVNSHGSTVVLDVRHPVDGPQPLSDYADLRLHTLQMAMVVEGALASISAYECARRISKLFYCHAADRWGELTLSHSLGPVVASAPVRCSVDKVYATLLQHSSEVPLRTLVGLNARVGRDVGREVVEAIWAASRAHK